jgi:hypothetical protein
MVAWNQTMTKKFFLSILLSCDPVLMCKYCSRYYIYENIDKKKTFLRIRIFKPASTKLKKKVNIFYLAFSHGSTWDCIKGKTGI